MLRWPIQIVRHWRSLLHAFLFSRYYGYGFCLLKKKITETDTNTRPHYTDLSLVHKQIIAAVSLIQAVLTHAYQIVAPVQIQSGSTLSHGATVRAPW